MRLSTTVILAGLACGAAPALAQDDAGRIVARVAVRDVTTAVRPGAYQGRSNGPEQIERFTRKVKIGRDGRFTLSNISGDITITAGSGDRCRSTRSSGRAATRASWSACRLPSTIA